MTITLRSYTSQPGFTKDFFKVREFLKRIYESEHRYGNWQWNRWEWMFSLPYLDETNLDRIGLWEDDGTIVALANYETELGNAWFSLDKEYSRLKKDIIEYAQENLSVTDQQGNCSISINIYDKDTEFRKIARDMGFSETDEFEDTAVYEIPDKFPQILLPEGFSLISLSEENDLDKYNRVLWRGFNHPGEPPAEEIPGRIKSQSGPSFNKDISIAVKSPDGDFVSYCGMWFDPNTDYAIVEPMATDPDYRLMGLGKAVLLEGIRRCGEMGAKIAYVGSSQQFYYRCGFRPLLKNRWWRKESG
ncbi:MAG: GNAT family N-acetyltransferase [Dehalococcoidales bacterium]|nr:MAG: GNAT family N-acetyltransferase [Dehalococcoidales bacterium]